MDSSDTARQSVLYLPEDTSSKIDVMLHQSHTTILRPALSVVVANHVFIIGIRIFSQIPLDQLSCLITCELEKNVKMVYISQIDSDGMLSLKLDGLIYHEFVFLQRRACYLVSPIKAHDEDIDDHSIELEDK